MATSQKFGGNWTEEKLNIFTSYLDAYLIALQNQKFKKIYIDAFAGTGEIETSDGGQFLVGSAKRALTSEKKFDHYYFIEADSQKAGELQDMIDSEFPQMRRIVTIYCSDANDKLAEIKYEAAQKLAYDFGIDPDKPPAAAALRKPQYPLAKAFQKEELHCQRVLCDYLHLLENWKVQYAPETPEDTIDDRFVEACQMLDYIENLVDILTFGALEVRVKTVDMLQKDGMIDRLEERLKRTAKEVDARDETEIG